MDVAAKLGTGAVAACVVTSKPVPPFLYDDHLLRLLGPDPTNAQFIASRPRLGSRRVIWVACMPLRPCSHRRSFRPQQIPQRKQPELSNRTATLLRAAHRAALPWIFEAEPQLNTDLGGWISASLASSSPGCFRRRVKGGPQFWSLVDCGGIPVAGRGDTQATMVAASLIPFCTDRYSHHYMDTVTVLLPMGLEPVILRP